MRVPHEDGRLQADPHETPRGNGRHRRFVRVQHARRRRPRARAPLRAALREDDVDGHEPVRVAHAEADFARRALHRRRKPVGKTGGVARRHERPQTQVLGRDETHHARARLDPRARLARERLDETVRGRPHGDDAALLLRVADQRLALGLLHRKFARERRVLRAELPVDVQPPFENGEFAGAGGEVRRRDREERLARLHARERLHEQGQPPRDRRRDRPARVRGKFVAPRERHGRGEPPLFGPDRLQPHRLLHGLRHRHGLHALRRRAVARVVVVVRRVVVARVVVVVRRMVVVVRLHGERPEAQHARQRKDRFHHGHFLHLPFRFQRSSSTA